MSASILLFHCLYIVLYEATTNTTQYVVHTCLMNTLAGSPADEMFFSVPIEWELRNINPELYI